MQENLNVTMFTLSMKYASLAVENSFTNPNEYLEGFFVFFFPLAAVGAKLCCKVDAIKYSSSEVFSGPRSVSVLLGP